MEPSLPTDGRSRNESFPWELETLQEFEATHFHGFGFIEIDDEWTVLTVARNPDIGVRPLLPPLTDSLLVRCGAIVSSGDARLFAIEREDSPPVAVRVSECRTE